MDDRPHILIVDDQPENLLILKDLLARQYRVQKAPNGQEALNYLEANPDTDLVLLDVLMPRMDGYEVCARIKSSPTLNAIPVLFLTSLETAAEEERGLSLGAEDFIHKPFSPSVVLARVRNQLQVAQARRILSERNRDLEHLVEARTRQVVSQSRELVTRTQQLNAAQGATITAFCALAEARDQETGNHILRTQNYVRALAERSRSHPRFAARLDPETILLYCRSAPLHDIGKVAIPDQILNKPGPLDTEEWKIMKRHCQYGGDAIRRAEGELGDGDNSFLQHAREIAFCHHEKWDGSGYPQGLAGEDIPLSARLMAVADVYDALISRRVYKPAISHEQAMAVIHEGAGTHFDPDLVTLLMNHAHCFRDIAQRYHDTPSRTP